MNNNCSKNDTKLSRSRSFWQGIGLVVSAVGVLTIIFISITDWQVDINSSLSANSTEIAGISQQVNTLQAEFTLFKDFRNAGERFTAGDGVKLRSEFQRMTEAYQTSLQAQLFALERRIAKIEGLHLACPTRSARDRASRSNKVEQKE